MKHILLLFVLISNFHIHAQNKLIGKMFYYYDNNSSKFYKYSRTTDYKYDSDGNIIRLTTQAPRQSIWENSNQDSFTYTSNHLVKSHLYYSWDLNYWRINLADFYSYDLNGQLTNVLTKDPVLNLNTFQYDLVNWYQRNYTYNYKKSKTRITQDWINNKWVSSDSTFYRYDSMFRVSFIHFDQWKDSTIFSSGNYYTTYNDSESYSTDFIQYFENGKWTHRNSKTFYIYSVDSSYYKIQYTNWDFNKWKMGDYREFFYNEFKQPILEKYTKANESHASDSIVYVYGYPSNLNKIKSATPNVLLYPNPTNNIINIKSTYAIEELQILDVNGRQVLHITTCNQNTFDVTVLKSGVYTVAIKTSEGINYQKLSIIH